MSTPSMSSLPARGRGRGRGRRGGGPPRAAPSSASVEAASLADSPIASTSQLVSTSGSQTPTDAFPHGDPARRMCLLCRRLLSSVEALERHDRESELHKTNLRNGPLVRAAVEQKAKLPTWAPAPVLTPSLDPASGSTQSGAERAPLTDEAAPINSSLPSSTLALLAILPESIRPPSSEFAQSQIEAAGIAFRSLCMQFPLLPNITVRQAWLDSEGLADLAARELSREAEHSAPTPSQLPHTVPTSAVATPAPPCPGTSSSSPPIASTSALPDPYPYASLERLICYLCDRTFALQSGLEKHHRTSEVHKRNSTNAELITRALERKRAGAVPPPVASESQARSAAMPRPPGPVQATTANVHRPAAPNRSAASDTSDATREVERLRQRFSTTRAGLVGAVRDLQDVVEDSDLAREVGLPRARTVLDGFQRELDSIGIVTESPGWDVVALRDAAHRLGDLMARVADICGDWTSAESDADEPPADIPANSDDHLRDRAPSDSVVRPNGRTFLPPRDGGEQDSPSTSGTITRPPTTSANPRTRSLAQSTSSQSTSTARDHPSSLGAVQALYRERLADAARASVNPRLAPAPRVVERPPDPERERRLANARRTAQPPPDLHPVVRGARRRQWDRLPSTLRRRIVDLDPRSTSIPCGVVGCLNVDVNIEAWFEHLTSEHAKCDVCGAIFLTREDLFRHERAARNHPSLAEDSDNSWDVSAEPSSAELTSEEESEEEDVSDDETDDDYDDSDSEVEPFCDMCDREFVTFEALQEHLDHDAPHASDTPRPRGLAGVEAALRDIAAGTYDATPTRSSSTCPWPIPCGICLDVCENLTTTLCGHVGCKRCLQQAVGRSRSCPVCRRTCNLADLHPVYLSGTAPSDLFLTSA